MPSSTSAVEAASIFGALDSDAFADGRSSNAHIQREIARNSRRLADLGQPILSLQWNVHSDDTDPDDPGAAACMADYSTFPQWQRILRMVSPHQPQLRSAYVDIVARISDTRTVYLQVGTLARPLRQDARIGDPNVFELLGTGDWETYSFEGLELGRQSLELIEAAIVGEPDPTALMSVAMEETNSGTCRSIDEGRMVDVEATFSGDFLLPRNIGRYWLYFVDDYGAQIGDFIRIMTIGVHDPVYTQIYGSTGQRNTLLIYNPNFRNEADAKPYLGASYTIIEGSRWRLGSFVITETDEV